MSEPLQLVSSLKSVSMLVREDQMSVWDGSFNASNLPALGKKPIPLSVTPRKFRTKYNVVGSASTDNLLLVFYAKNSPNGEQYWFLRNGKAADDEEYTVGSFFDTMEIFYPANTNQALLITITGA